MKNKLSKKRYLIFAFSCFALTSSTQAMMGPFTSACRTAAATFAKRIPRLPHTITAVELREANPAMPKWPLIAVGAFAAGAAAHQYYVATSQGHATHPSIQETASDFKLPIPDYKTVYQTKANEIVEITSSGRPLRKDGRLLEFEVYVALIEPGAKEGHKRRIGQAEYYLYPNKPGLLYLDWIGIDDGYQKKGIGTALLKHVVETTGCRTIKGVPWVRAIDFYKKLGALDMTPRHSDDGYTIAIDGYTIPLDGYTIAIYTNTSIYEEIILAS